MGLLIERTTEIDLASFRKPLDNLGTREDNMAKSMIHEQVHSAAAAGTFTIGGDLTVNRLGYGAMRITGPGIWGPPADEDSALATLRRAIDLDVNLVDTADSYGPAVSEELIAKALYPYPSDLVIATKGGWERSRSWTVDA